MWDDNWDFNGTLNFNDTNAAIRNWQSFYADTISKNESPELIDDAQAQKLKVARFAHVPVDCLELKTKIKEA